mmetsp:Transcript_5656/g.12347  ORF Transcript_5656/g.12347 Transcript_5656/m.12347 type:complete len:1360 (-) Transcript_5656:160-4239(-)
MENKASLPQRQERPVHPFQHASFLSKLFFIWPYSFMNNKNRAHASSDDEANVQAAMQESDLPDVLETDSSERNLMCWKKMWEAEIKRAENVKEHHLAHNKGKPLPKKAFPSLHRAIVKDYFSSMWFVQPCMLLSSTSKMVQALALGYLLQTFEVAPDSENTQGYLWAGVLVLSGFVVLIDHHHVLFWGWTKGMHYRISSVAAIYDKSLRLNSTSAIEQFSSAPAKNKTKSSALSTGKIVNIAASDIERFLLAAIFGSYLIWAPLISIAILGVGWYVIGWSFAAGFGILIFLFVPLQSWLGKKFGRMRSTVAAITDERVTLVSQAVSGVRVMKMSGWEDNFEERIATIRKRECDQLGRVNSYRVLNEAIYFACNATVSVIIFVIHVASGGVLTTRTVFTCMALVNVAQLELTKNLSLATMAVSECWISISRIQRFLETPELEKCSDNHSLIPDDNANTAIEASHVVCYWNGSEQSPAVSAAKSSSSDKSDLATDGIEPELIVALDDVSVDFDMGTLTFVIGSVGSGKSALIQMLAEELPLSGGTLRRRDCSVAYAPQDPWIMNGTVKENILLGKGYVSELYSNVIHACGLNVDLAQLPSGEDTIVGDRGVQLSGGQRARIALARAFYRDADILLLDDPLSAVDSRVGRLLFYSAIQDLGVKRGKCVILVTHQHQYIGDSRCVMMSDGKITCIGSYVECVEASGGKLTIAAQNQSADDLTKLDAPQGKKNEEKKEVPKNEVKVMRNDKVVKSTNGKNNAHKEKSRVGVVKLDTFLSYCRAMPGGITVAVLMLILYILTQGSSLLCIAAIGRWSEEPAENQSSRNIIGLVTGLVGVIIVLALVRAGMSFHLMIQASKNLHDGMTRSVLRAKIEFFDTNPIGRILNRFSADIGSSDDRLPTTLFDFLQLGTVVIGALVSAIVVLPVTLAVVPPLVWYFLRVRNIFLTTSRELKRMDGAARSPILATLSESISGLATIRANDATEYFKQKFRLVHDAHGRSFFAFVACSRWLGFRLDALMFVFLTVASFAAVVAHQQSWFNIDPGILGLAITMLIQLSGLFAFCIRQSAEVVNLFVAVERVVEYYRDLPSEAALANDYDNKTTDWPANGEIVVKELSVRYRAELPLSLRGLTFTVKGGTRVGVVGRTGSGKSTLVQALLRLLEAEEGQIIVDGVDIAHLGLHKLRTCISVIPQSPVLYGGCSLRENLDPFHHHSDEQISEALLDVHMLEAVRSLSHELDTTVAEGGLNFSVGQRQLLCLARAILCRNKILVLDEPTANVDSLTDKLLQEAVAKSFEGATILAVAHRLDTVIDYDMILVLGEGGVLEYGTPHELIKRGGAFCGMVGDTGREMAGSLKARAGNKCD